MTIAVSLVLAAFGQQAVPDPADQIRASLDEFEKKHFRGLLYVEKEGKELFFATRGLAIPGKNRPFTRETGIEIGSIVKPFVRVAIYHLAAQGKIRLSDSISKYFPETPEDKKAITLEMLLLHRAGFQDVFGGDYKPMERDELMKLMLASKLIFEPNSKSEYSNCGYSMLATIIEKVTGQPIEKHLAETQFKPLGMKHTGYVLPDWGSIDVAHGSYEDEGKVMDWGNPLVRFNDKDGPSWNLRGNGGMVSTVLDLARWCRAAHTGELMRKEDYAHFSPSLASAEVSDTAFWFSAGGNSVFNCVVAYNPKRKLTLIAFSADARFAVEESLRPLLAPVLKMGD